jgi:SOS-response transcriptional repressor LexA
MVSISPEMLAEAIEQAGTTPAALALAIGRDKDYIRDYLVGRKRSLKADDLMKITQQIGPVSKTLTTGELPIRNDLPAMPVVGTIRAGAWIETYMLEHDDQGVIPVARDHRFPYARQYALAVSGDSMDQEAPDGSFVICVDFGESGLQLKAGMIAHVESMEHGKSETTLKEVAFENGEIKLIPRSSNPVYKAISLNGHEGLEVFVRGIVLSVYNPLKF